MLMSFQPQYYDNNHQHQQQHAMFTITAPPPATLTTADMQRLRESFASRVDAAAVASSATRYSDTSAALAYVGHGARYPHDQSQSYDQRCDHQHGSHVSHRQPHGPYPQTTTSDSFAYSQSSEVYDDPSSLPSRFVVHPMSQHGDVSSWPQQQHEFRAGGAMFSSSSASENSSLVEDEYTDASILREVLQQDTQQHAYLNPPYSQAPYQASSQYGLNISSSYSHNATPSSYSMATSSSFYSTASDTKPSSLYMNLDALSHTRSASASSSSSFSAAAMMTSSSPSSSSYVSSSADSPVSSLAGFGSGSNTSASASGSQAVKKKPAASRICRMPGCSKGIRSRGLCKGHGGGRRCLTPGCEISDQGGGHCIAHGGGKRCHVIGCQKSAQSKGLCKLHGGARRCKVPECAKNCQIKGLCRLHYSMFAAAASSLSPSSSELLSPSKFAMTYAMDLHAYGRSQ